MAPARPERRERSVTTNARWPASVCSLVDDDRDICEVLQFVLEGQGAVVTVAASAAEALAALERSMPNVLLSDIAMPGETGYDLMRKIVAREGDGAPPAAALSAYAPGQDLREGPRVGLPDAARQADRPRSAHRGRRGAGADARDDRAQHRVEAGGREEREATFGSGEAGAPTSADADRSSAARSRSSASEHRRAGWRPSAGSSGALPNDTGMAYVLVQHLDPHHDSILAELLSEATQMEVSEVKGDVRVEPNRVYVIPPSKGLILADGMLKLVPRSPRGVRAHADRFLPARPWPTCREARPSA